MSIQSVKEILQTRWLEFRSTDPQPFTYSEQLKIKLGTRNIFERKIQNTVIKKQTFRNHGQSLLQRGFCSLLLLESIKRLNVRSGLKWFAMFATY